jgi:hypothetical protein
MLLASVVGCDEKDELEQDERSRSSSPTDAWPSKKSRCCNSEAHFNEKRSNVRDKRAALLSRKLALSEEDSSAKEEIAKEETELVRLEARLVKQELALNKRLEHLLERKSGLVAKLGERDEQAKAVLFTRREYSLTQRERDLARRETELSQRERELAKREQAFAERQARVCPGGRGTLGRATAPNTEPSANDKKYGRQDVEPLYRKALRLMRQRGILIVDLPAGVDSLVTETRHAVSRGEYARAKYSVDQLLDAVREIRIDRAFIGVKIDRLAQSIRRTPPQGAKKPQGRAAVPAGHGALRRWTIQRGQPQAQSNLRPLALAPTRL